MLFWFHKYERRVSQLSICSFISYSDMSSSLLRSFSLVLILVMRILNFIKLILTLFNDVSSVFSEPIKVWMQLLRILNLRLSHVFPPPFSPFCWNVRSLFWFIRVEKRILGSLVLRYYLLIYGVQGRFVRSYGEDVLAVLPSKVFHQSSDLGEVDLFAVRRG